MLLVEVKIGSSLLKLYVASMPCETKLFKERSVLHLIRKQIAIIIV